MKALPKTAGMFALVLIGVLASGSAMAQHRGHGHGHGHNHGGNVRFGISLGIPLFGPAYYPAPYYAYPAPVYAYPAPVYAYPGAVIGSSSAPVYIERGAAQAAPPPQAQTSNDWFYCAASGNYYPYVAECPAGWQRVPAQSSSR